MGLLKSGTLFWGVVIGLLVALAAVVITLFGGVQAALIFLGMPLGMAVATVYFIVRVLDPMYQSLKALEAGENDPANSLVGHLPGLIMDARAGRLLSEALASRAADNASAAADISRTINEMGTELDQQVSRVEEMIAEMTRRIASGSGSASLAAEAVLKARHTGELSRDGRADVSNAISSIREVHGQTHETLHLMEDLNGKSEKIQSVTSVIEGIAAQTNLLALNAAIEAARAGDQGRGFAVVADEVRQLSARTARATEEVAETLQAVRSDTGVIVGRIKKLAEGVEAGLGAVETVGERLGEIQSNLDQMVDRLAGVSVEDQGSLTRISQGVAAVQDALRESSQSLRSLRNLATGLSEQTEEIRATFTASAQSPDAG